jgi:hypothetical protein
VPRKKREVSKVRKRVSKVEKVPLDDPESELVLRISDCERVVNELDISPVWGIVQADLQYQRQNLDDRWQDITDPQRVMEARILKCATMHILTLKNKYQEELTDLQKQLETLRNTDKAIVKDYDSE